MFGDAAIYSGGKSKTTVLVWGPFLSLQALTTHLGIVANRVRAKIRYAIVRRGIYCVDKLPEHQCFCFSLNNAGWLFITH